MFFEVNQFSRKFSLNERLCKIIRCFVNLKKFQPDDELKKTQKCPVRDENQQDFDS